jgi:hypothetical protein
MLEHFFLLLGFKFKFEFYCLKPLFKKMLNPFSFFLNPSPLPALLRVQPSKAEVRRRPSVFPAWFSPRRAPRPISAQHRWPSATRNPRCLPLPQTPTGGGHLSSPTSGRCQAGLEHESDRAPRVPESVARTPWASPPRAI